MDKTERLKRINAKLAHIRSILALVPGELAEEETHNGDLLEAIEEVSEQAAQMAFLLGIEGSN
jgi:hypothetical protein